MKRATWCGCGCCSRKLLTTLPMRAVMLTNRRRIAEMRAAHEARAAEQQLQIRRAVQLATAPAAGNA